MADEDFNEEDDYLEVYEDANLDDALSQSLEQLNSLSNELEEEEGKATNQNEDSESQAQTPTETEDGSSQEQTLSQAQNATKNRFSRHKPMQTEQGNLQANQSSSDAPNADSSNSHVNNAAGEVLFEDIIIKIIGSAVRLDIKSRAYTSYLIAITYQGIERWRIEKRYSDFFHLDEKFRKEFPELIPKLAKLPEKTVLKRLAPSVIDNRKAGLEAHLQSIIYLQPNWQKLAEFLSSDMRNIRDNLGNLMAPRGQKEGFLSKKGRKLGTWKPRYFIFRGGQLSYYQTGKDKDGPPGGVIPLENASIYIPQEKDAEKHSFVLISEDTRHILCAENDAERDEWFQILSMHIEMMIPVDDSVAHPEQKRKKSLLALDNPGEQAEDSQDKPGDSKTEKSQKSDQKTDEKSFNIFKKGKPTDGKKGGSNNPGTNTSNSASNPTESKKGLVFGVSLKDAVIATKLEGKPNVPAIVVRCIDIVEQKGLKEEGIYRISGNQTDLKELRDRFDSGTDVDLKQRNCDPHCAAGLLKSYLREIPEPILTNKLKMDFFSSTNIEDKTERINEIARLIASLPACNLDLLQMIMEHLNNVLQYEEHNKMNVRNIGIVFSPTLQIPAAVFSILMSDFTHVFATATRIRDSFEKVTTNNSNAENSSDEEQQQEGQSKEKLQVSIRMSDDFVKEESVD